MFFFARPNQLNLLIWLQIYTLFDNSKYLTAIFLRFVAFIIFTFTAILLMLTAKFVNIHIISFILRHEKQ